MMALPLVAIARILGQLTVLVPAANTLVKSLRRAVSKIPENPSAAEHLDDIERALKLQVEVTENLANQLQMIQSVLGRIQKSLKLLTYTVISVALVALLAIVIALFK
jgi:predicted PurR-regulated permease PerM